MGEIFAVACAVLWAIAVILFKRSGESVPPLALNLFRVTSSLPMLLATALLMNVPLFPDATGDAYLRLVVSAVIGIVLSDTLFHKSLNMVGAGITAVIDTSYSPITVLLAFLLLGERIGLREFAGMALISSAILLSTTIGPHVKRSRTEMVEGVVLGVLAIASLAVGIVIVKPVLDGGAPVLWVATVRQAIAAVGLVIVAGIARDRRALFAVWKPSRSWRTMLPGSFIGSYLALVLWIAGMKYTLASVSAILNQSSTVFILLFAVLFLRERMTRRKAAAALLAITGVLLVSTR